MNSTMFNKTILHVKKDGREFFAVAEPFWAKYNIKYFDSNTKAFMNSKELQYKLRELKDGKLSETIGFVADIKLGSQILKTQKNIIYESPKIIEYNNESIFIIEKIYEF